MGSLGLFFGTLGSLFGALLLLLGPPGGSPRAISTSEKKESLGMDLLEAPLGRRVLLGASWLCSLGVLLGHSGDNLGSLLGALGGICMLSGHSLIDFDCQCGYRERFLMIS